MKHTIKTSQLTLTEPYHVLHAFCNSPPHEIRRSVAVCLIKKMNVICLDASFKRTEASIPFSSYLSAVSGVITAITLSFYSCICFLCFNFPLPEPDTPLLNSPGENNLQR